MAKATGAREAHSEKIKAALINAYIELQGDPSVDSITINSIVEKAGVAKGSFYNHFPDKGSLGTVVSRAIREEVEERVTEGNRNVTDPAYRMSRGVCYHIQLAVEDPLRAAIMLQSHELAEHSLNKGIEVDILKGVESGRFSPLCEDAGIVHIVGLTAVCMIQIVKEKLDAERAITLTAKALTLTLCGFGLAEEEAARISLDSAKDIIG